MKAVMKNTEYIDLTNLKPTTTVYDILTTCGEAIRYNCASVCIPSGYVKLVRDCYEDINICTVVGFPHNNIPFDVLLYQVAKAITDGTNEIDMVVNLSKYKNGYYDDIIEEINKIKELLGNKILKVIIETCYLTKEEIRGLTKLVDNSNADYIKTSTGFGTGGATFEDIEIMKKVITKGTKIKASGGIRTKEEVQKYIDMGCDRIGMSQLTR